MKKIGFFSAACLLLCLCGNAQNLAINTDGSKADANAILDVKSNNKGLLIPRMSSAARLAIPPTNGMLVYDLTTKSFWYNTGAQWQSIASSTALSSMDAWLLNGNAGTDSTNFLGTTDNVPLNIRVNNIPSGRIDHIKGNAWWGFRIGQFNTTGQWNTAIGSEALHSNTTGNANTATGYLALYSNTEGLANTATGEGAMYSNITGMQNTAAGSRALHTNTGGFNNLYGDRKSVV